MQKLDWDSKFWGIEVFSINDVFFSKRISTFNFDQISKDTLIQALVGENELEKINILVGKGFRFVESKITLKKESAEIVTIDNNRFNKIKKTEIDSRSNIFYELYGKFTRFNIFNKNKVNDFYYAWVINSIKGVMDDKCIGYYIDNQLAGFITYRYTNTGAIIGLVGVFPEYRKKGINQKLLYYVNNDVINKDFSQIFISTQGNNIYAINTYIKNGFFIDNIKHWYYMRLKKI